MRPRVALVLLLAACDAHVHAPPAEEPEAIQVTVWSDRYELFNEYAPAVAGTPVRFAAHATDLSTFEPVSKGAATFILRLGDEPPIEHVEPAPARAGIYTPELTFPKPGTWSVTVRLPTGHEVRHPDIVVHASAATATATEAPEGISFLKEQQWMLGTRIEPVGTRSLTARVRAAAVVTPRTGGHASVTPPIAGRLGALPGKTLPALGDAVEAGQPLARIEPVLSDLAVKLVDAEAELARATLAVDQAKTALERTRRLAGDGAKSARELQESELAFRTAEARHAAAQGVLRAFESSGAASGGIELRAPIKGVIAHADGSIGEYVTESREVFSVVDPDVVFIEARVPEADLARLGATPRAVYEWAGRFVPLDLLYAGIEVNEKTRTVPFVYRVENADRRLRIGMALTVLVEQAAVVDAIAVPVTAIVDVDGRWAAYVQIAGETFEKRDVTLGVRDAGWVEVVAGLRAGERVVTHGAYAVRLASTSTSIPAHGHSH